MKLTEPLLEGFRYSFGSVCSALLCRLSEDYRVILSRDERQRDLGTDSIKKDIQKLICIQFLALGNDSAGNTQPIVSC